MISAFRLIERCEGFLLARVRYNVDPANKRRRQVHRERHEAVEKLSKFVAEDSSPLLQQILHLSNRHRRLALFGHKAVLLSHRFAAEQARRLALISAVEDLSHKTAAPPKQAIESVFHSCGELTRLAFANKLLNAEDLKPLQPVDYSKRTWFAKSIIRADRSEFEGMASAEVLQWLSWAKLAAGESNRAGMALENARCHAYRVAERVFEMPTQRDAERREQDALATIGSLEQFLAATALFQQAAKVVAATAETLRWRRMSIESGLLAEPLV